MSDFQTDQPIKDEKLDILGFCDYAKIVSKGIINFKNENGLVLSLCGTWGIGKTTMANFIKSEIEKMQIKHFKLFILILGGFLTRNM